MKHVCTMLVLGAVVFLATLPGLAQEQQEPKPIPVVTGYGGFNASFEPGKQTLSPNLNPIILVPFSSRFLVEAEFEMESDIERENGVWGPKTLDKNIEYLQLDYLANRHLTVVVGRFLTPFGIFNERLHPSWIKNVQEMPLIFGLEGGSSTGAMLRGGVPLSPSVNLNYAGYFSALLTHNHLLEESERSAGGRWSLFFPRQRFEAGFSFNRKLGEERFNAFGFDATWNVRRIPLDVRAEYARSAMGSGYWVEGAYRFSRVPKWRSFFRKSQAVVRVEQFFAPVPVEEEAGMGESGGGGHGGLPIDDTQRAIFGWNYYFREGLKLSLAYGRSFTSERDHNTWSVGIAYRFLYW